MGRRESPVRAPRRNSPSRRERERERERERDMNSNAEQLSTRNKSSRHSRSRSPARERRNRPSAHTLSPKPEKLPPRTRSPKRAVSESPSPRTKRLKRAKAKGDAGRDREHEESSGRKGDRATHAERGSDREFAKPVEKSDRRSGRDENYKGSGRQRRGASPSSHRNRADSRGHDELRSPRDDEQQNGDNDSVAKMKAAEEILEAKDKQNPSFELSGKLAAETNRFRGVTLLFNEPPDARMSDIRWRLYVFKGGEALNEPLYVHRQSCYLFGRERRVADIPTDHPSCSKQHAVLQYRQVEQENPDGSMSKRVRPYLMDLGSTNGTFINDDRIEAQRYYELFEKDNIKFGNSSREYVLLHENSTA